MQHSIVLNEMLTIHEHQRAAKHMQEGKQTKPASGCAPETVQCACLREIGTRTSSVRGQASGLYSVTRKPCPLLVASTVAAHALAFRKGHMLRSNSSAAAGSQRLTQCSAANSLCCQRRCCCRDPVSKGTETGEAAACFLATARGNSTCCSVARPLQVGDRQLLRCLVVDLHALLLHKGCHISQVLRRCLLKGCSKAQPSARLGAARRVSPACRMPQPCSACPAAAKGPPRPPSTPPTPSPRLRHTAAVTLWPRSRIHSSAEISLQALRS